MSAADRIALGASALALRDNAAWQSAVRSLDEVITEQWRQAPNDRVAWEARMRLRALNELLGYLEAVVADAETARGEQESERSAIDRILAGEIKPEDRVAQYRDAARAAWAKFDEPHDVPTPSAEEVQYAGDADTARE